MKVTVLSYSWGDFTQLSDITSPAWQAYCDRHGYTFIHDWKKEEDDKAWQKPKAILKHLPDTELLMWVDADTCVTNPNRKIEDIWYASGGGPLVITADCYGLNAGVMLMSNVPVVQMFWKAVDEMGPLLYPNSPWDEQEAVTRFAHNFPFKSHVCVLGQNMMNSYLNAEYGRPETWPGNWQHGDFLIHFPGLSLERRIELVKEYVKKGESYVSEQGHQPPRSQQEQNG